MGRLKTFICSGMLPLIILATMQPANAANKPKLILQITVDQFHRDLSTRYFERLDKGGIRYLPSSRLVHFMQQKA